MADDDPVVQEFDVFLSKTLESQLYIFQYPLRPKSVTYDDATIVEARVKPQQQKVELELALKMPCQNFDRDRAEEIARAVNSGGKEAEPYFTRKVMDRFMLTSSKVESCSSRCAVGIIRDNELHLTPVSATMHIRPHPKHLDFGATKGQDKSSDKKPKTVDAGHSSQEEEEEEEEEAKQVTVRFARAETDKAKKAREKSYHYIQQKTADEAWVNVVCNPYRSEASQAEFACLQCVKSKAEDQSHLVTKAEYTEMLIPGVTDSDIETPNLPSSIIPMAQLHSMPLGDQVKNLLINAKVMKFSQLMTLVSSTVEPLVVLRSLQQVAVLVQGNWVVKSDVLYPKGFCSTFTGVSAELLCKARDYIMWRFTQAPFIKRKEVSSLMKVPSEDLKDILEQMSRVKPVVGWTFCLPIDDVFLRRYPDVVQRQQMIWEAKSQQLSKLKITPGKTKDGSDVSPGLKSPTKARQRKRTKSSSPDRLADASPMEVDAVASGSGVGGMLSPAQAAAPQTLNGNGGYPAIAIKQEVVDASYEIKKEPPMSNGDWSETHAGDDEAAAAAGPQEKNTFLSELGAFVRECFVTFPCLTTGELKRLLTGKMAQSPPGHVLRTGVTDKLLELVCQQAGAEQLNKKWMLPLREPPIFVSVKTAAGENDPKKEALVSTFRNGPKMRKGIIKKHMEEALGSTVTDTDLGKLLKDFCIPLKSGYFVIKHVNGDLIS